MAQHPGGASGAADGEPTAFSGTLGEFDAFFDGALAEAAEFNAQLTQLTQMPGLSAEDRRGAEAWVAKLRVTAKEKMRVEAFGLGSPEEAAPLTPRGLRARWRVLALRAHPDHGGTSEAFRALGRHYRVLAAACGHGRDDDD